MHLTDYTDYSLQVLIYLNKYKNQTTLTELSSALRIPRNHLIKISNELVRLGYLESVRGRSGGVSIKESTGKLSIKEIVQHTENNFHLASCFNRNNCEKCTFVKNCKLKKVLAKALDSFFTELEDHTLDDVTV